MCVVPSGHIGDPLVVEGVVMFSRLKTSSETHSP
jgi:hypothetical protein